MTNEMENINLKDQILKVAGRMFLEYGYSGTTFQKDCRRAGDYEGQYHLPLQE